MGKTKLDLTIQAIFEAKEITPKGQSVTVYLSNILKHHQFYLQELKDILRKLEDDEKILTLMRFPNYLLRVPNWRSGVWIDGISGRREDPLMEYFTVTLLDGFDDWCADYWAKSKQKVVPKPEAVYRITLTSARELLLNDNFRIARPDFERENEQVFNYLYNHPNEKVTKKQLEEELRIDLVKSLHKIVENLGFTGALKKAFFNVSKNSIEFRNPVTSKDLSSTVSAELNSLIAEG